MNNTSSFTRRVLATVSSIPKGKTMTYKEVARAAGNEAGARAVGMILSKNYNPHIPCHRVVRTDGGLGGYNRGLQRKKELLEKEKRQSKKKGFTLVELMVIVSIISVFATIVIFNVTDVQEKARDDIRRRDLVSLARAVDVYLVENGVFPGSSSDFVRSQDPEWETLFGFVFDNPPHDPTEGNPLPGADPGFSGGEIYQYQYLYERQVPNVICAAFCGAIPGCNPATDCQTAPLDPITIYAQLESDAVLGVTPTCDGLFTLFPTQNCQDLSLGCVSSLPQFAGEKPWICVKTGFKNQ